MEIPPLDPQGVRDNFCVGGYNLSTKRVLRAPKEPLRGLKIMRDRTRITTNISSSINISIIIAARPFGLEAVRTPLLNDASLRNAWGQDCQIAPQRPLEASWPAEDRLERSWTTLGELLERSWAGLGRSSDPKK